MSNEYKYPTTYELKEILSTIANRPFLNDFAQRKGLFVTHSDQNNLATELANIYYDEIDLEIIRKEAYKENHHHTLSGFVIKSNDKRFNLKSAYESLRTNGNFSTGIVLNQLSRVNNESSILQYKGSFEYTKKKPGRIEFLQDEVNSFDFYLTDLTLGSWKVEVDCNKSTDTKEIRKLFVSNLAMDEHTLELIDQDKLSAENTIMFFDRLANEGMAANWSFLDIKHLTVKRARTDEEDEELNPEDSENDESEDELTKDYSKEQLTGISQAILEGKNLREDPFVKDCEGKGYRFTAMTYEFENSITPQVISVKAEFKGRPKVFEVGISDIQEKTGPSAVRRQAQLSIKDNRELRSSFWNNARNTYNSILNISPGSSQSCNSKHRKPRAAAVTKNRKVRAPK